MRRFVLACLLCAAMLGAAVFVFMPKGLAKASPPAKENVIEELLNLPAPPPPNPLMPGGHRDGEFYDPKNPPPDNAPIDDLIDYWTHQAGEYRGVLFYLPRPSEATLERLFGEIARDPGLLTRLVSVLPEDRHTADLVNELYNREGLATDERVRLKAWMMYNTPYFSDDLERNARQLRDVNNYVNVGNQNALLALTRHDFDSARPIIERLYSDNSQPVSKALATWALYRHAMESGAIGDVDRYRGELMRMVEDRSLADGVRDMANDAIVREPDFLGRDEWCFSLFEDETLVHMPYFTGLTTLMMYAPPDKYVPKMTELLRSGNKTVRTAAAHNLLVVLDRGQNPEIVRALLPWLEDPKWIDRDQEDASRQRIVAALQTIHMPESVPGLLAVLDEKATRSVADYSSVSGYANAANAAANAARVITNTMSATANATASANVYVPTREETFYPYRTYALRGLATQGDARAIPALRRLLAQSKDYERAEIIRALLLCTGFSLAEQVEALEYFAKKTGELSSVNAAKEIYDYAYNASTVPVVMPSGTMRALDLTDMRSILGSMVAANPDVSDTLARATIDRIEILDGKDPQAAATLRQVILNWRGLAVSALLLRDLKNGRAESAAVVRLLAERKVLREKLNEDISDAHSGTPAAAGIAACILEDTDGYDSILVGDDAETKSALFACGRLIRAPLPVAKVAESLKSANPLLKSAAEHYLESEDSPEARSIVLGQHPDEAKIMGATIYFKGREELSDPPPGLLTLFASVNDFFSTPTFYNVGIAQNETEKSEKKLQKEVKENRDLLGIYAYENSFVRIFKDKAVFSWEDDPSRYHERNLTTREFARMKEYLAANNVNELKPFLSCSGGGECGSRELLMLGRSGGCRVFAWSDRKPEFFAGLEKILADFRVEPSSIKYAMSKDVPGLELLFASDDLQAQTVWKQGGDLRIVVSSVAVRTKVDEELSQMEAEEQDSDETDTEAAATENAPEVVSPVEKMREKRQYEGYAWHKIESGRLGDPVAQPAEVEYIPLRDSLEIQPGEEQWKSRAAGFEIRADPSGLYKVERGKLLKIKAGNYSDPVFSANGRWLIANKYDDDEGEGLVRYNLTTNREYKVEHDGNGSLTTQAFVPAVGKYLVIGGYLNEDGKIDDDDEDQNLNAPAMHQYYLLDPETGMLTSANGELRPLSQQTFRPLQPTTKPNEFWAALPSRARNETVVGRFDSRLFRFNAVVRLPKIIFESMNMWVDESEGKIYFVYNGHLLRVPMKTP